jgi:predicted GIY-YIG superfamily endonuclease
MSTLTVPSIVYLLHFERPFGHAMHYIGSCHRTRLQKRLTLHNRGRGARLTAAAGEAGIRFVLARTWDGGRQRERQIKTQGGASRYCPICKGHDVNPFEAYVWPAERAARQRDEQRELIT